MRKTTSEERPVKKTIEEWLATRHTDKIARMKEHVNILKERMKKNKDKSIQHTHLKKHIDSINKRIKDYEDKVKG